MSRRPWSIGRGRSSAELRVGGNSEEVLEVRRQRQGLEQRDRLGEAAVGIVLRTKFALHALHFFRQAALEQGGVGLDPAFERHAVLAELPDLGAADLGGR